MRYKLLDLLAPVAVLALSGLAGCQDEKEESLNLARMFMPTGQIQARGGETSAKLSWKDALFTDASQSSYTVEVATDSLFTTPVVLSATTDTTGITLTDEKLAIRQRYYARVKTNGQGSTPASNWVISSRFMITGEQILSPLRPADIKDQTVLLRWRATPGLTRVVLTPAGGQATELPISAQEATALQKLLTGLTPSTAYEAEIFAGSKSKGRLSFTTQEKSIYAVLLTPADDLAAAISNAANNDVIGLEPGTYDSRLANLAITGKQVTIQSVSGNPKDTKVLFKEITLKGTGAGVKLAGIEFDGTTVADYFINVDAEAGTLNAVVVQNAIVHETKNCFMRANRAASGAQKMDLIKIDNTIAYANGTGTYHYFTLDKLEFKKLEITNSTFYDIGRAFIGWATNFTSASRPEILIDKITLNSFGFGDRNNILLDANNNAVAFTLQNSIIANSPKPGQAVLGSAMRANAAASEMRFVHNNYFNLQGGNPLAPLTFPDEVQRANNKTIDLGWTAATSVFTLPAGSVLRTASTSNGPIGDPRWAQ